MQNRFLIAALVAAAPAALLAHHSTPLYDMKKSVTVEGRLTDVKFGYPHVTARMTSQKKTWKLTFPPVSVLSAGGFTQKTLASAKVVKIIGNQRKDGKAELRVAKMTVDGKTV